MKKLMLVAAVVLMGAVANAASVTWQVFAAGSKLADGTTGANIAGYLYQGSLSENVIAEIAAGSWKPATSGFLFNKNTTSTGAITQAGIGSYENETVSFSMILLNGADYASSTQFKYAEVKDVVFTTANKTVAFTTPLSNAQWADIAPEPTSGLLLLLGMGALALRRKQA